MLHRMRIAAVSEEVPAPPLTIALFFVFCADAPVDLVQPRFVEEIGQSRRRRQNLMRIVGVFADIRRQQQEAARRQPAGHEVDRVPLDQTAPVMALLEPGSG